MSTATATTTTTQARKSDQIRRRSIDNVQPLFLRFVLVHANTPYAHTLRWIDRWTKRGRERDG